MPLAKQTAELGLANWAGAIILYVVFYMPMNILLYSGYLVNIPIASQEAASVEGASIWRTYWKKYIAIGTVEFPITVWNQL